jgi:hypothetical protein
MNHDDFRQSIIDRFAGKQTEGSPVSEVQETTFNKSEAIPLNEDHTTKTGSASSDESGLSAFEKAILHRCNVMEKQRAPVDDARSKYINENKNKIDSLIAKAFR